MLIIACKLRRSKIRFLMARLKIWVFQIVHNELRNIHSKYRAKQIQAAIRVAICLILKYVTCHALKIT